MSPYCAIPKQKHKVEFSCLQVREPASLVSLDCVYVVPVPFARWFIVNPNDLGRSVYGNSAARGKFFGVVRDARSLLNGCQSPTVGVHVQICAP